MPLFEVKGLSFQCLNPAVKVVTLHILLGKIDYEIGECLLTRQQGEVNKIALSVKLSVHESYKEVITRVMFL